jgi:hypothetical protein
LATIVRNHAVSGSLGFFPEYAQLGLGNGKFRDAAIQTNQEPWKHPHDGLVQTLESREMNGEFAVKLAPVLRSARLARHYADFLLELPDFVSCSYYQPMMGLDCCNGMSLDNHCYENTFAWRMR